MESDNLVVGQHNGPEHKVLQATSSTTAGNLVCKKNLYFLNSFLDYDLKGY